MIKNILRPAIFCDRCGEDVESYNGHPYIKVDSNHYCPDCALIIGELDALTYISWHGIGIYEKAAYKDGVITAFQKWGRGYRKDEWNIDDEEFQRKRVLETVPEGG
jgi:hypothetical protein